MATKQSEKWTQLNYTTRITIIKEREREGERREKKKRKETRLTLIQLVKYYENELTGKIE